MASEMSQQYAYRSQKSLGLVGGSPDYESLKGFEAPEVTSRTFCYSPDGRFFAYVLPDSVCIHYAESAELLRVLELPNIIEISFSPRGTYISTWERMVKLENDAQHKNLRVFSVSTGDELTAFTQKAQGGWELQFTISESHAVRLVGQDIQVFTPADWSRGITQKLRIENVTAISVSPGLNPHIAVFTAGKNAKPAKISIYSLLSLSTSPTCQKSTFRADSAQFKWNTIGTQVLALVRTDVDATNKNYYGESRLYLLSASGNFDCLVATPKEGPIHDYAWSPNSKEFSVVCGFTPMKAVIFDSRVKIIHDFGTAPQNFVSFNPQGRLIALAGFGNLSGQVNIYDRRTLEKVASIDAPNTTFCEWSPDGRFLLTATLSPRLRVDNGIKIWHCTGTLMHIQLIEELYQTSWRPIPVESAGAFPPTIPSAPPANASVALFGVNVKATPSKPVGAYRPPGARGQIASAVYERESEPNSGTTTPARPYTRSPAPGANGSGVGRGRGRYVPGAASPSPAREEKKQPRSKRNKAAKKQEAQGGITSTVGDDGDEGHAGAGSGEARGDANTIGGDADVPATTGPDNGALDPVAKKLRNLKKKLKAIAELKEKLSQGEKLEDTQVAKIRKEDEIQKELETLSLQVGVPIGS